MQTLHNICARPTAYAVEWSRASGRSSGRSLALAIALLLAAQPAIGWAQGTRTLTACTSAAFTACAELRLTATPDAFELALRTIGDPADATRPVAFYNLVLGTGAPAAASPTSTSLPPGGAGGATVRDASNWELFDAGDALFLSALSNHGVGGCAVGADVGDFGQAVTTCGAGQFAVFRFAPTAAFDPNRFRLLNLEAVALTADLPAASCGAPGAECVIIGTIPEPRVIVFTAGGLVALVGVARRRRQPA